jgi:hypothetical protein
MLKNTFLWSLFIWITKWILHAKHLWKSVKTFSLLIFFFALPLSHFYLFIIISLFALILGQPAKKGY